MFCVYLITRDGLPLNYEWLFAKTFAQQYNMTPNHLKNLITGKTLSWNALYEEIVGFKS